MKPFQGLAGKGHCVVHILKGLNGLQARRKVMVGQTLVYVALISHQSL